LQIDWRLADHPQHLGRDRLLFERLAQFPVARLQFLEEPGILDGDDRLVGKGLELGDCRCSR
jgi:hypothetical protein